MSGPPTSGEPESTRPLAGPADVAARPEPAVPVGGPAELADLRRQAGRLVAEVVGPLRRILLRSGDAVLEIEWHGDDGDAGPERGVTVPVAATSIHAASSVPAPPAEVRQTVRAPTVGTYYRAAEPGGPPFVEVGDKVEPGQVIGIVEAMKLMNEVVADQVGRVVDLLVRDGESVEFGQPLIALVPA